MEVTIEVINTNNDLGVQLDLKATFKKHNNEAVQGRENNKGLGKSHVIIEGLGETKRRIICEIVHSQMLYGSTVCLQKKLSIRM